MFTLIKPNNNTKKEKNNINVNKPTLIYQELIYPLIFKDLVSSYVLYRYNEMQPFNNITQDIYHDYLFILDTKNNFNTEYNKNHLNFMDDSYSSYEGLKPRNQIEFFKYMTCNLPLFINTNQIFNFIDLFIKKDFTNILINILGLSNKHEHDFNVISEYLKSKSSPDTENFNFLNRCVIITTDLNTIIENLREKGYDVNGGIQK
jgi:hypothetical protein